MKIRQRSGRSGKLWLQHRLDVASTGADLLDKKRRALVQEFQRLRMLARTTEERWRNAAADAELWANRLAVVAGEDEINILAATHAPASVNVRWRSAMGVVFASEAELEIGPAPVTASGGSAAADLAVPAARSALEAAVTDAVTQSAFRRIRDELALTARRQRALERRWIPALLDATATLNRTLDELELEEAARSLWAGRRDRGAT